MTQIVVILMTQMTMIVVIDFEKEEQGPRNMFVSGFVQD